jgi:hypothetical protein
MKVTAHRVGKVSFALNHPLIVVSVTPSAMHPHFTGTASEANEVIWFSIQ